MDEALEVVAHSGFHARVEQLLGQVEKRLRIGQVKVNLEKALWLRQVEFRRHRVTDQPIVALVHFPAVQYNHAIIHTTGLVSTHSDYIPGP